jgi:ATP-dependent helicase HrpB
LAPLVKETEVITWDTKKGGLIATKDLRIGNIILRSTPLPAPNATHLAKAISDAVKREGQHLLNFDDTFINWQNRVLSLRKWRPTEQWPDVSTYTLLVTNSEWLSPYLIGVKHPEDLKKIDLKKVLHSSLDYDRQLLLDKLAPEKVKVPSGSEIEIKYQPEGAAPVLAVRLQELFGMFTTPLVNDGKIPLLIHLLSPGYKPVQVTSDLKSFWENTYFEVKKELKRRYPKHSWPDDPLVAEAVRGVKRKIL